jgi:hypothetical protein
MASERFRLVLRHAAGSMERYKRMGGRTLLPHVVKNVETPRAFKIYCP